MSSATRSLQGAKRVRRTQEVDSGLPMHGRVPDPDFRFAVYPNGWEHVMDPELENGWLPCPRKIPAKDGANGVTRGNIAGALAGVSAKGGTIIEPSDGRLGAHKDYVATYTTDRGQLHHVEHWREAEILPNGSVIWREDIDVEQWREFRQELRDGGIVPMPPTGVYRNIVQMARERLNRQTVRWADKPAMQPKIEALAKHIERMESDWEAWQKAAASTGTTSTRRPKKTVKRVTKAAEVDA